MVLRMKNFNIWGFTEKSDFQLGVHKKKNIEEGLPRKGGLSSFSIQVGGLARKSGMVLLRGWVSPMHTMLYVYIYFVNIFFLFFINKNVFSLFSFHLYDEISNICNRILANQKPEQVIKNCQWNCMCNSSVINISRVSLPPCQVLKVDLGQPIQIQLMDSAELWDST